MRTSLPVPMISAARAAHTRWLWAQAFCRTKNTSLSVSYFHLAVWWRPQTGAQWRAGFFFWAAFRLANRSQAKVGLLRGTLRSRAHARRVGTRFGVYPAKAGHPGRALFIRAVRVSDKINESTCYPSSSRLLVTHSATAHAQHQQRRGAIRQMHNTRCYGLLLVFI